MAVENLITEHIDVWTSVVKTRSTSGRGSSKKLELYGVKKLRELILELAVRGKLVPQDPNDEPASVLLERIAAEKAQLVKEKKIKRSKALPLVSTDEQPFQLPNGWAWERIGTFGVVGTGATPSRAKPEYWEPAEFNWVSSGETSELFVSATKERISGLALEETNVSIYPKGTLIVAMYGQGKTRGQITELLDSAGTNQACAAIQLVELSQGHRSYVKLFFRKAYLDLRSQSAGGAQPNLNVGKISNTVIPVPPLPEQHRIVAKVDELMALCDQLEQQTESSIEAHQVLVTTLLDTLTNSADADELMQNWARISEHFDTLFTTEESIDQLKQAILQLAVMGKLVPQDPSDEPATELLKRIAEEKAQLVKEKRIKKQKALPPISEDEKPFELPNGWEWCRIQDVALFTTSGSRDWAKYYSDSGALFVTMGNLSRGSYELRLDNLRFVRPPKGGEGSRTKLEARDLLISITGDVGNLGLIPEEFGEAYINQHTCLLRFMPECQGKYFPDFMRSPLAKYQFDAPQRGIKNSFRLSDVGEMHVPLPPLNEQVRITEKVSDFLSICECLKVRLRESQITRLHLTDAIVDLVV
ncbi:restriction endonuclease subunit S [Vibrio sonorensis]|uniref:restriction endonuclease subunit S n=1 Tax=Vibrio sonorensis TaxID=1004316 RepID=UPI0008D91E2B|nr:restriction endonuclease subunit S [Vibrio sonorensis]